MQQYCPTLTRDFGPLDEYKKAVFRFLIFPYAQGNIADVGSSYTGLYRSLGYAQIAQSINFFDRDQALLDTLITIAESCQSGYFSEHFGETCERIDAQIDILPSYDTMIQTRNTSIDTIQQWSFFDPVPQEMSGLYDTVLCIESLECVDTREDLLLARNNILSLLTPGGRLCLSILRYDDPDAYYIQHLRQRRHEGGLNPDYALLETIALETGCCILTYHCVDTTVVYGQYGYNEAIMMVVEKGRDS